MTAAEFAAQRRHDWVELERMLAEREALAFGRGARPSFEEPEDVDLDLAEEEDEEDFTIGDDDESEE